MSQPSKLTKPIKMRYDDTLAVLRTINPWIESLLSLTKQGKETANQAMDLQNLLYLRAKLLNSLN